MENIISLNQDSDRLTVLGRDLHEKLEIKTAYKDWFPRMCEYGFTEGEDFNPLIFEQVRTEGGREVKRTMTDHQLTIDMAKQICMLQRTEVGKRYREYFLEVEKKWNSPEAVMARALKLAQTEIEGMKAQLEAVQRDNELLQIKADYCDCVLGTSGSLGLLDTARLFGVSPKVFTTALTDLHYCYRNRDGVIFPYMEYIRKGWFELTETSYHVGGETRYKLYTRITRAGRDGLYIRLRKEGVIKNGCLRQVQAERGSDKGA